MRYSTPAMDRMKEAIGGDAAVLADILQSFVEEADTLAATLHREMERQSMEGVGRTVHTIKSSARDFGDDELAQLCAGVEQEARGGAVNDLERRGSEIAGKCLQLRDDVAAYIRTALGSAAP
ncbi:MAG: Hpt domain-containing protein [Aestuariivirga sp.]